MPTATLTSKGQLTVPLAVRRSLGLEAGTKVDFVPLEDGFKLVPLHGSGLSLKGRFAGRSRGRVSLADMDNAVASEAAARAARARR